MRVGSPLLQRRGGEGLTGGDLAYYRLLGETDRITTGPGRLEPTRTQEILRRHLPRPPANLLDIGGGTGAHAAWLAADGNRGELLDVVPEHVAAARLAEDGLAVTARLGDARELPVADDAFDAALLLGPLYHLTEREDRLTALREARRAVRPGGLAFVAAINRFASLFDGLAQGFLLEPGFREIVETDLRTGRHHNPGNHPSWFTTAYFHHPDELRAECHDAGLDVVELVGVEGMAGRLYPLTERWDDPAARAIESEPSLLGLSPHPLLTARVPA